MSRFFSSEEVDEGAVLSGHVQRIRERCGPHERILAVQDTSPLNYSSHTALQGLGETATSTHGRSILIHSTMIMTEERTPLGVAATDMWTRDEDKRGMSEDRRGRDVSDKESRKWITGLRAAENAVPEEKHLLVMGDRESDVYALLVAPRRANTDLLIRIAQNRALETDDEEHKYLKDALRHAPEVGGLYVDVPRAANRKARRAKLKVQLTQVTIKPPLHCAPDVPKMPVKAWVIRVSEVDPPADVKDPLEWMLLTTEPVEDLKSAVEMVGFYTGRWMIEEYHHVLKTGCNVERLQLDSADRLKPAIAVNAVVAWRVLYLTKYSRECPESPASEVASPDEIAVLERWLESEEEKSTTIGSVKEFVRAVALLGGFMGRKHDGNPGVKVLWQGIKRLQDFVAGYKLATLLQKM